MKIAYFALFALFLTTSCVETVVVAGATGVVVATREKSLVDTKDDVIIGAKLDAALLEQGLKSPNNSVSTMVNEGRVLLIGEVREAEKGKLAQELAWKVKGVKEVIDEIKVNEKDFGVADVTHPVSDSAVTFWLKTKLFFTPKIVPSNFKINTLNGTVYLFGVAKSDSDLRKVLSITSKTRGVKRVVNHIIQADDPRRK